MRLVTRQQWGARPPRSVVALPRSAIDTTVFHYSGADADEQADHANCAGRVRGIQRFHMDTRGWLDIAYSFLVCVHGYVFAARGYGVRTAATGRANGHSLAVCFLGNDSASRADVTPAARQAHVEIARAINERYARVMRYAGHRDFMATACPGDELYRYIRSPEFARASVPSDPSKELRWLLPWPHWKLGGEEGPRPRGAPREIPEGAWAVADAINAGEFERR
jgi:N-acetylmuramoyl-L-alanine amidase